MEMKHGDGYYHKINCKYLVDNEYIVGYKNSDFDRLSYEREIVAVNEKTGQIEVKDKTYYYYMHEEQACYYCIVNPTIIDESEGTALQEESTWRNQVNKLKAFNTTMAREKYNFYKTNSYFSNEEE